MYIKRGVMKTGESAVNVIRRDYYPIPVISTGISDGVFPSEMEWRNLKKPGKDLFLGDVSTAFPKNTGTSLDMTGICVDTRGASLSSSIIPFITAPHSRNE